MPIDPINGILDYPDNNQREAVNLEQIQAEDLLLGYLLQNYALDTARARRVVYMITASGESLPDLVWELQRESVAAMARIQAFVDQVH